MIYELDFKELNLPCNIAEIDQLEIPSPYENTSLFENHVIREVLPSIAVSFLHLKLEWFRNEPFHAAIIRNAPKDNNCPSTPLTFNYNHKKTFLSEAIIYAISCCFGETFSYKEEYKGCLIKNIFPRKDLSEFDSNNYGAHELKLHTEVAWAKMRPDYLVMNCIRTNPEYSVATNLVTVHDIIGQLNTDEIEKLREFEYQICLPEMFRPDINESYHWTPALPIITGSDELLEIRTNLSFARSFKNKYASSLIELSKAATTTQIPIILSEGDILIINNRNTLHGRSSFKPRLDGSDRWIQQIYVKESLLPYKSQRLNRYPNIFSAQFSNIGLDN